MTATESYASVPEVSPRSGPALARRELIPCPDCGLWDVGEAHFCHADEKRIQTRKCLYCWAPVEPKLDRYHRLQGWPSYCSITCGKLDRRPYDARATAATVKLIESVAGNVLTSA